MTYRDPDTLDDLDRLIISAEAARPIDGQRVEWVMDAERHQSFIEVLKIVRECDRMYQALELTQRDLARVRFMLRLNRLWLGAHTAGLTRDALLWLWALLLTLMTMVVLQALGVIA